MRARTNHAACEPSHLALVTIHASAELGASLQQSPGDDPVHRIEVVGEDGALGGELVGGDVAAGDFVLPGAGGVPSRCGRSPHLASPRKGTLGRTTSAAGRGTGAVACDALKRCCATLLT